MMIDLDSMEVPTEVLTLEEQQKLDGDCHLAKREHKWCWVWKDGKLTDQAQCAKCGQIRQLGK